MSHMLVGNYNLVEEGFWLQVNICAVFVKEYVHLSSTNSMVQGHARSFYTYSTGQYSQYLLNPKNHCHFAKANQYAISSTSTVWFTFLQLFSHYFLYCFPHACVAFKWSHALRFCDQGLYADLISLIHAYQTH